MSNTPGTTTPRRSKTPPIQIPDKTSSTEDDYSKGKMVRSLPERGKPRAKDITSTQPSSAPSSSSPGFFARLFGFGGSRETSPTTSPRAPETSSKGKTEEFTHFSFERDSRNKGFEDLLGSVRIDPRAKSDRKPVRTISTRSKVVLTPRKGEKEGFTEKASAYLEKFGLPKGFLGNLIGQSHKDAAVSGKPVPGTLARSMQTFIDLVHQLKGDMVAFYVSILEKADPKPIEEDNQFALNSYREGDLRTKKDWRQSHARQYLYEEMGYKSQHFSQRQNAELYKAFENKEEPHAFAVVVKRLTDNINFLRTAYNAQDALPKFTLEGIDFPSSGWFSSKPEGLTFEKQRSQFQSALESRGLTIGLLDLESQMLLIKGRKELLSEQDGQKLEKAINALVSKINHYYEVMRKPLDFINVFEVKDLHELINTFGTKGYDRIFHLNSETKTRSIYSPTENRFVEFNFSQTSKGFESLDKELLQRCLNEAFLASFYLNNLRKGEYDKDIKAYLAGQQSTQQSITKTTVSTVNNQGSDTPPPPPPPVVNLNFTKQPALNAKKSSEKKETTTPKPPVTGFHIDPNALKGVKLKKVTEEQVEKNKKERDKHIEEKRQKERKESTEPKPFVPSLKDLQGQKLKKVPETKRGDTKARELPKEKKLSEEEQYEKRMQMFTSMISANLEKAREKSRESTRSGKSNLEEVQFPSDEWK